MDWIAEKDRIAARLDACTTNDDLRAVWMAERGMVARMKVEPTDPLLRVLGVQLENLKDYRKPLVAA